MKFDFASVGMDNSPGWTKRRARAFAASALLLAVFAVGLFVTGQLFVGSLAPTVLLLVVLGLLLWHGPWPSVAEEMVSSMARLLRITSNPLTRLAWYRELPE